MLSHIEVRRRSKNYGSLTHRVAEVLGDFRLRCGGTRVLAGCRADKRCLRFPMVQSLSVAEIAKA